MKNPLSQTWDLDVFFNGGSASQEFVTYLDSIEKEISNLKQMIDKSDSSVEDVFYWRSLFDTIQMIDTRIIEAAAFTGCLTAQNMKDQKAVLLDGRVQQILAAFTSVMTRVDAKLLQVSDTAWESILSDEKLRKIAFGLEERRHLAKQKMSADQESLASDLSVDGYHAWQEIYNSIVSRMSIPFEEDGKTVELSVGQAFNKMHDGDRSVREAVAQKWEEAWSKEAELIAAALNHLAGFRINLYRNRGWESVLKEPLAINRMSEQTLNVMWDVINGSKNRLVAFLNRKAKLFGLEQLNWTDVAAPLGNSTEKVSYDEAADFIVEHFRRFSPKMADFAVKAFENRWIEAEDRPGKRPGGFCTSFSDSEQTRIFMTFDGSASNVATLAHELGHAYHQYVMRDLPPMAQNYAMNVAETASTFAEMIVADASVKNARSDSERLELLEDKAQRSIAFFMNIHARFLFETRFYEARKKGLISVEELNELMVTAQKEAFRDALSDYHPHFWASKLHFYSTDVPFYNFPYTFGYLFSYGVYARALEEGAAFEDKYVDLLRDTASMTVEELALRHLGVDLTKPDFWQSAVDLAVGDVEEFLQLTE